MAAVALSTRAALSSAKRNSRGWSGAMARVTRGTVVKAVELKVPLVPVPLVAAATVQVTTVTDENRMIGFPYPKYMNSNNDVDMGAALIMCSVFSSTVSARRSASSTAHTSALTLRPRSSTPTTTRRSDSDRLDPLRSTTTGQCARGVTKADTVLEIGLLEHADRVVVVHEAPRTLGMGAEIAARVMELAFDRLARALEEEE